MIGSQVHTHRTFRVFTAIGIKRPMTYVVLMISKKIFPAFIMRVTFVDSFLEIIFFVSLANRLESLFRVLIADLVAIRDKELRLRFRHITCDFKCKQKQIWQIKFS